MSMSTYSSSHLESLPVEILYDIQLRALSSSLPRCSKRLHTVYHQASLPYHATYLVASYRQGPPGVGQHGSILSTILRYPLCSPDVLDLCFERVYGVDWRSITGFPILVQLPKRLFKHLNKPSTGWTEDVHPLPFLRHLDRFNPDKMAFDINSNEGYPLVRAVYAGFVSLIQYLLDRGADPYRKDAMAIKIAIRADNVSLVRMLIERTEKEKESTGRKKRKLMDRGEVDAEMLKIAVKRGAEGSMRYLMEKRGVVPSIQTLGMMTAR